jgi:hypothetical protein
LASVLQSPSAPLSQILRAGNSSTIVTGRLVVIHRLDPQSLEFPAPQPLSFHPAIRRVGHGQIHHLQPNPRRFRGSGSIRPSPTGKQRRAFVVHGDLLRLDRAHYCRCLRLRLVGSSGLALENAARMLATAASIASFTTLEFGVAGTVLFKRFNQTINGLPIIGSE